MSVKLQILKINNNKTKYPKGPVRSQILIQIHGLHVMLFKADCSEVKSILLLIGSQQKQEGIMTNIFIKPIQIISHIKLHWKELNECCV